MLPCWSFGRLSVCFSESISMPRKASLLLWPCVFLLAKGTPARSQIFSTVSMLVDSEVNEVMRLWKNRPYGERRQREQSCCSISIFIASKKIKKIKTGINVIQKGQRSYINIFHPSWTLKAICRTAYCNYLRGAFNFQYRNERVFTCFEEQMNGVTRAAEPQLGIAKCWKSHSPIFHMGGRGPKLHRNIRFAWNIPPRRWW